MPIQIKLPLAFNYAENARVSEVLLIVREKAEKFNQSIYDLDLVSITKVVNL